MVIHVWVRSQTTQNTPFSRIDRSELMLVYSSISLLAIPSLYVSSVALRPNTCLKFLFPLFGFFKFLQFFCMGTVNTFETP